MRLHRCLQITNNHRLDKPRRRRASTTVVMPETQVVQSTKTSRHSQDEAIDRSSLEDGAMRIREGANRCLIVVATEHKVHLGLGASILSMAGEDDDLVEVVIILVIVSQKCDAELERRERHGETTKNEAERECTFWLSCLSRRRAKIMRVM